MRCGLGMGSWKGWTGQNSAERFKYLLQFLTPKETRSEMVVVGRDWGEVDCLMLSIPHIPSHNEHTTLNVFRALSVIKKKLKNVRMRAALFGTLILSLLQTDAKRWNFEGCLECPGPFEPTE